MRLSLAPEIGGAILSLTYRGIDLLRPVADPRLRAQQGRAVAAYPLIPYANRIAQGRFICNGQAFQLPRNFAGSPHSIHGNAWMTPWSLMEIAHTQARLGLAFSPGDAPGWPFAYRAEQIFTLTDDALRIELLLENRDTASWPAGLGLHPYIARSPQTTLRFQADSVFIPGRDELPAQRQAVQGATEFDGAKLLLGETEIDACYAGWGGGATIRMPETGLVLTLTAKPPLDHLQLYTPAGRDYFGLEPVSNMPDAINRMDEVADQGLVILRPGDRLKAEMTLGISLPDQ